MGVEKDKRENRQQRVKGREGKERVQKSKEIIVGRKRENGGRCT